MNQTIWLNLHAGQDTKLRTYKPILTCFVEARSDTIKIGQQTEGL